ncbi:Hypothetical protein PBC10988_37620 [Planctomycetales bacterium 10988]|nr:Hypothetical protein PBC10988_37620 [Planctomycetales bacterium 10988]
MAKYDDLNIPLITTIGLLSTILTFVIIVLVQVAYYNFEAIESERKKTGVPFSQDLIAAQQSKINQYGWLDKKAGKASIPIDRAMDLVVKEYQNEGNEK